MTDREKREKELTEIAKSANGRDRIADIYREHYTTQAGIDPTLSIAEMIAQILNAEFGDR